jgi:hypothetical protein
MNAAPTRAAKEALATDAQRAAADPAASVWVTASAGTGKTKVLTDRLLALLLAGTEPGKILCLTFTKAAAAEMANRLADRLATWASAPEADLSKDLALLLGRSASEAEAARARSLFARVLDTPGGMKIQTIHAFCQSLLGRFPVEAEIAPHFQVLDERTAAEMLEAARAEVLAGSQGPEGAETAADIAAITAHAHEQTFAELMEELIREGADPRAWPAAPGDPRAGGLRGAGRAALPAPGRRSRDARRGADRRRLPRRGPGAHGPRADRRGPGEGEREGGRKGRRGAGLAGRGGRRAHRGARRLHGGFPDRRGRAAQTASHQGRGGGGAGRR